MTKLGGDYLDKEIERVHRGKVVDNNNKLYGKRNIYIAFYDWNVSSEVLDNFRKHGRKTGIFVDQMYGPDTTYRRNEALKYRKDLFDRKAIAHGFVDHPAKLMVKKEGENGYKLERDFSNMQIPLDQRKKMQ